MFITVNKITNKYITRIYINRYLDKLINHTHTHTHTHTHSCIHIHTCRLVLVYVAEYKLEQFLKAPPQYIDLFFLKGRISGDINMNSIF
jgi:hypothetical protein